MTELEQKIQQENVEKQRKFPLLDITDNRAEISEISIATQDYMIQLNPDVKRLKVWEAIPRIVMEFITTAFTKLEKSNLNKTGMSSVVIGDIMELGIDYMNTSDAAKDGNITPFVRCRSEFKFENATLPYQDEVPVDIARIMQEEGCEGLPIQFFEDRKIIKEICISAMRTLRDPYGIIVPDNEWWLIALVVVAFMRKAKEFLIDHKDSGDVGVTINFADIISFGIKKEGGIDEDDPVDYYLFISPQQVFKKENGKDDSKFETVE